jgi:hypothetical protein
MPWTGGHQAKLPATTIDAMQDYMCPAYALHDCGNERMLTVEGMPGHLMCISDRGKHDIDRSDGGAVLRALCDVRHVAIAVCHAHRIAVIGQRPGDHIAKAEP